MGKSRELLERDGIYFPLPIAGPGHHEWAHQASRGQLTFVDRLVESATATVGSSGSILVSSEDFENLLAHPQLAAALEAKFVQCGCSKVTWGFSIRSQYDYLVSLYAELSKHGVVMNIRSMADQAIRAGRLEVSNGVSDWVFVFDYVEAFDRFAREVSGRVAVSDFADETLVFPGSAILRLMSLPDATLERIATNDSVWHSSGRNRRLPPLEVERRYATKCVVRAVASDSSDDSVVDTDRPEAVLEFDRSLPAIEREMRSRFSTLGHPSR